METVNAGHHDKALSESDQKDLDLNGSVHDLAVATERLDLADPPAPARRTYLEQPYYKYEPLDLFGDSVRLIELLPHLDDGFIQCRLKRKTLRSNLGYSAVSYMWGKVNTDDCGWIKMDGTLFAIGPNLWDFLNILRCQARNMIQVLWIDAISLNQANVSERNHQVQRMNKIYSHADQVFVWLGQHANDSELAFDFIEAWTSEYRGTPDFRQAWATEDRRAFDLVQDWNSDLEKHRQIWDALIHLCSREYWGRCWVLQEIVLARDIIVHCHESRMHWKSFALLLERMMYWHSLPENFVSRIEAQRNSIIKSMAYSAYQQRNYTQMGANWPLRHWLERIGNLSYRHQRPYLCTPRRCKRLPRQARSSGPVLAQSSALVLQNPGLLPYKVGTWRPDIPAQPLSYEYA